MFLSILQILLCGEIPVRNVILLANFPLKKKIKLPYDALNIKTQRKEYVRTLTKIMNDSFGSAHLNAF